MASLLNPAPKPKKKNQKNPKTGLYIQATNLKRGETGERPEFPWMLQSFNSMIRERALHMLANLCGAPKHINVVFQAQDKIEFDPRQDFPARHEAGCSTQYAAMLCHITNGDRSWYIPYLSTLDETIEEK